METRLYYKNGDKEINLRNRENMDDLIVNKYGYDEYFSYRDVDKFMDNLYLEVKSDEYNEIIKLHFTEVESNDDFVYALNNNVSDDESSNVIDDDIPKYVRDNFKYDSDSKSYVYEHKDGDTSIVEKYSSETNNYYLNYCFDNVEERYSYDASMKILKYVKFQNSEILNEFDYNYLTSTCIKGSCKDDILKDFNENYYSYLY